MGRGGEPTVRCGDRGLGSGKSSLVKAGLVPALPEWQSVIVRLTDAGGDPIRALAMRLESRLRPAQRLGPIRPRGSPSSVGSTS